MPDYRSKTSTHGRNMAGARAVATAGMADMQVRLVNDVQLDRVQRGQPLPDEFDAFLVHLGSRGSCMAASSLMCLPNQKDCAITKRIMRIMRPKTLKLTHCASVNWPEKAT